jgi:hypothetical protein
MQMQGFSLTNYIIELKESKYEILTELRWETRSTTECWLLEEWRRISLPEWQRILKESIERKNEKREEYARWMLPEVLEDPKYGEEQ